MKRAKSARPSSDSGIGTLTKALLGGMGIIGFILILTVVILAYIVA